MLSKPSFYWHSEPFSKPSFKPFLFPQSPPWSYQKGLKTVLTQKLLSRISSHHLCQCSLISESLILHNPPMSDSQDYLFVRQMPSFLYSSPPSYDTVAKKDRTELPTYQQACRLEGPKKVWVSNLLFMTQMVWNSMWYLYLYIKLKVSTIYIYLQF